MPNILILHGDFIICSVLLFLFTISLLLIHCKSMKHHIYYVFCSILSLFIIQALWYSRFTIDDAFISLRYARNLAEGHGLNFDTTGNHAVEGYSNFLYTAMLSLLYLIHLSDSAILVAVKLIGIAFGILNMVILYRLARIFLQQRTALTAMLIIASVPYLAFWSIGGLETSMYIYMLNSGIYFSVKSYRWKIYRLIASLFFLLAALTRPEGIICFLLASLGLVLYARRYLNYVEYRRHMHNTVRIVVCVAIPYLIYFAWRYAFYGYAFPNTYYAKSGAWDIHLLNARIKSLNGLILYLLPFAFFAWSGAQESWLRNRKMVVLLALCFVINATLAFASKREWMPGYRYELPCVAFLLILASVFIDRTMCGAKNFGKLGFCCHGFLLGFMLLYPARQLKSNEQYFNGLKRAHIAIGKWLKQNAPPDSSYAGWDMGAIPYYSELPHIIDINSEGILNAHITHCGYDAKYLISSRPTFIGLCPEPKSGVYEGMSAIYREPVFRNEYERLAVFYFEPDYSICLFKRKDAYINDDQLKTCRQLALRSMHEVHPES